MLRISFYNVIRDLIDFIKDYKWRILFVVLVGVAGAVFGGRKAAAVTGIEEIIHIKSTGLYMVLEGSRGFWRFLGGRLLIVTLICLAAILLSCKRWLSVLNLVIIFFFSYNAMYELILCGIIFKLSYGFALILTAIFYIVYLLTFSIIIVHCFNTAGRCGGLYRKGYVTEFTILLKELSFVLFALLAAVLLESILMAVFTL